MLSSPKAGLRTTFCLLLLAIVVGMGSGCSKFENDSTEPQRNKLVDQLAEEGIKNKRVLDVMRIVPRHLFVPKEMVSLAYENHPIKIREGETLPEPFIAAYMTAALSEAIG